MNGMQAMRAVEVPIYDFTRHQRSRDTRRVEPADVVILEVRAALSRLTVAVHQAAAGMISGVCRPFSALTRKCLLCAQLFHLSL